MAPSSIRQLLGLGLPSVVFLISYLWYKKRRIGLQSDTGGERQQSDLECTETFDRATFEKELLGDNTVENNHPEKINRSESEPIYTRTRKFSRSLSGVESAPIDIVYPKELKTSKSNPVVVSDQDLDWHIERIKSMKNHCNSPSTISANLSKTPSPKSEKRSNNNSQSETTPEKVSGENTPAKKAENLNPVVTGFDITSAKSDSVENTASVKSPVAEKNNTSPAKPPTTLTPKANTPKKNNRSKTKKEKSVKKKMAQKDIAVVEEKMSTLKVSNNKSSKPSNKESSMPKTEQQNNVKNEQQHHSHREIHRQNSGRDSANHSPSDVMMASPSLSSMSDNHSEGSSDSGKGGSEVATPPSSRTPNSIISNNMPTCYEFIIPFGLVGKMIGRRGCFVQGIRDKTNAHVTVKDHPTVDELKVCSVEGTEAEIEKALKIIREKFPLKKYADVTLEQVHLPTIVSTVPLIPDYLYVKLIEGINNDTILSCMVAPNHLFMQQPTHPSFPSLNVLTTYMNHCYRAADSPLLPTPIPENTVCAAFSIDNWYRVMVLSTDQENDTSYVKFLDYGGYAYVENAKLRQIRQDFMLLPFQGAECFLSNIKSKNEDGSWPEEAYTMVANVTKGSIIYTQVADYTPEGVPLVLCYVVTGPSDVVFLNQRLVEEGFADWFDFPEVAEQQTEAVVIA